MIIMLDAGHGGIAGIGVRGDPGAVGNGLQEKDIVLKQALDIGKKLTDKYECEVLYTRTTDIFVTKPKRAQMANTANADLFISFHINSHTTTTAQGYEDFIRINADRKTQAIRAEIHDAVSQVWIKHDRRNRGQKMRNFAVLRLAKMPAVLVENGFIRNIRDAQFLQNTTFMNELNDAHVKGIVKALDLKELNRTYTVKAGDTLWSIAATKLGNGTRYIEIRELNKLTSNLLTPGQVLLLP